MLISKQISLLLQSSLPPLCSVAGRWRAKKNKLSATDVSLLGRRKFNTIYRNATTLSNFPTPTHFVMEEKMVALEREYSAGERSVV